MPRIEANGVEPFYEVNGLRAPDLLSRGGAAGPVRPRSRLRVTTSQDVATRMPAAGTAAGLLPPPTMPPRPPVVRRRRAAGRPHCDLGSHERRPERQGLLASRRTSTQTAADQACHAWAMKAPALLDAAERLAEWAREKSWAHTEYPVACFHREAAAHESHGSAARVRAAKLPHDQNDRRDPGLPGRPPRRVRHRRRMGRPPGGAHCTGRLQAEFTKLGRCPGEPPHEANSHAQRPCNRPPTAVGLQQGVNLSVLCTRAIREATAGPTARWVR